MWFRLLLLLLAALAWAFTLWVGGHVSSDPAVLGRWSPGYAAFVASSAGVALLLSAAQAPPLYRRLHAIRTRLMALAISVAIGLLAVETLARVADPLGISYYETGTAYHLDKIADPELVYRHRPDFVGSYGGVQYSFNELGLRERPLAPKAADELRILFLGDSMVLGLGVPVEETFVRRVEQLLTARLGRTVRTINSGVGSYNTTQEFAFLRRHGVALDPDLVVLVYILNDIEPNRGPFDPSRTRSLAGKSPPQIIRMVLGRSWLYRLLHHLRYMGYDQEQAPDRDSPGWRDSMAHVALAADYCRDRGTPFLVFLYRMRPVPVTDALWVDLSALARSKGFPLWDTLPPFADKDPQAIRNSVVDTHLNPEGHRILAEWMAGILADAVQGSR
jgi:lysophospholipase L1-like esterase